MKEKFNNIKISLLPPDVKEVFALIEQETNGFTDKLSIEANKENFDKAYKLVKEKFPKALKDTKNDMQKKAWQMDFYEFTKKFKLTAYPNKKGIKEYQVTITDKKGDYKTFFADNHFISDEYSMLNIYYKVLDYFGMLHKGLTKDEFIVLGITKTYKPVFRQKYFKDNKVFNKLPEIRDILYKRGYLLKNGGITPKGNEKYKEINPNLSEWETKYHDKKLKEILKKWDVKKQENLGDFAPLREIEINDIQSDIEALELLLDVAENKTEENEIKADIEALEILLELE